MLYKSHSYGYIVCESVKNGKLKFFRYEELTFLTPQDIVGRVVV